MTTKKLSDIGTLVVPSPESVTQFEPFVQMTLEERIEFAVRCYEAGVEDKESEFNCISYRTYKRGDPNCSIGDFLKDEGL